MMGMFRGGWPILFLFLTLSSCRNHGAIPLIGLDEKGKEFRQYFLTDETAEEMGQALEEVQEKTLMSLDSHPLKGSWELSRVDIGFGVGTEIGVASFKVGATPFFLLRFERRR